MGFIPDEILGLYKTPASSGAKSLSRDEDLAVRTIIGEAKGEGARGWEGVADVIRNRSKQSGKSFADVVLAPGQFEPWSSRKKELESYDSSSPIFQQVARTVLPVLRGEKRGPAGDATHFYGPASQAALGRPAPSWDNGKGIDIGNHRFFNLGYSGKGVHGTETPGFKSFDDVLGAYNYNTEAVKPAPVNLGGILEMYKSAAPEPVSESPDTIQAQAMSALNPNQTARVAVLLKPEEVSQIGDAVISQFIPLPQKDGRTLFVAKQSGRKGYGFKTPKDVEKYVAKNGFAKLIGKVEDVGTDTADGVAAQTFDPATGTELTSSKVTNPEAAVAQIATDQIAHPGAESTLTTADQVIAKRLSEHPAATNPPFTVDGQPFTPPDVQGAQNTEATFGDYQEPIQTTPQARKQAPAQRIAPKQRVQEQVPTQDIPTNNIAPPSNNTEVIAPNKSGTVSVQVDSLTPEMDDSRVAEIPHTITAGDKEPTDWDIIGGNQSYQINLSGVPSKDKNSVAMNAVAAKLSKQYGVPVDTVLGHLGDGFKEGSIQDQNDVTIEIPRGVIASFAGKDAVTKKVRDELSAQLQPLAQKQDEAMRRRQVEDPKLEDVSRKDAAPFDENIREKAVENIDADEAINKDLGRAPRTPDQRLKDIAADERRQIFLQEIENGPIAKELREQTEAGNSTLNKYLNYGIGSAEQLGAGMLHYINKIPNVNIFGDDSEHVTEWLEKKMRAYGNARMSLSDEAEKPTTFLGELADMGVKFGLDAPRIFSLPGGAAMTFGADTFLKDVGKKNGADIESLKSAGQAAIFGKILEVAGGAGKYADSVNKLVQRGVSLGSVVGATTGVGLLEGQSPKDAFKEGIKMGLFDAVMHAKGDLKVLKDVVFKATDGKNEAYVTITPEGEAIGLPEKPDQPTPILDVSERISPKELDAKINKVMKGYDAEGKRIEKPNSPPVKSVETLKTLNEIPVDNKAGSSSTKSAEIKETSSRTLVEPEIKQGEILESKAERNTPVSNEIKTLDETGKPVTKIGDTVKFGIHEGKITGETKDNWLVTKDNGQTDVQWPKDKVKPVEPPQIKEESTAKTADSPEKSAKQVAEDLLDIEHGVNLIRDGKEWEDAVNTEGSRVVVNRDVSIESHPDLKKGTLATVIKPKAGNDRVVIEYTDRTGEPRDVAVTRFALDANNFKVVKESPFQKLADSITTQEEPATSIKSPEPISLKVGDEVTNGPYKGRVFEDKAGTLKIERKTGQIHPITEAWKKTPNQLKLDKKLAKAAKKGPGRDELESDLLGDPDTNYEPQVPKKYSNREPDPESFEHDNLQEQEIHARTVAQKRFPLEMEAQPGYERSKTSHTKVIEAYQGVLDALGRPTPIRTGRMTARDARGVYNARTEVIRLKEAGNLPTAAHEIFHGVQKVMFGGIKGGALAPIPKAALRELVHLGKDLYGDRRPNGGYRTEGFAEFGRLFLTHDNAKAKAPAMYKYFTEEFLPNNPEIAKGLTTAREVTDAYRQQGAQNRAAADMSKPEIMQRMRKITQDLKNWIPTNVVDEMTPLINLSKNVEKLTGKRLSPGESPSDVAQYLRGNAQSKTHYMVFDGMLDAAGNKTGPGLVDAVAKIRGRQEDFVHYLWARRALERWSKDKNPGMTKEDAQFLFEQLDSPEFQLAAQDVYNWNAGIMNYVKGMVPDLAPTIDKILRNSQDYVPLMREMNDLGGSDLAGKYSGFGGNALQRMTGSGRRVKNIFPQMIANAERMISMAHKRKVLDTIVQLEKLEGVGSLLEEVPRDKVPQSVQLTEIENALKDAGANLKDVDLDQAITFFTPAKFPKGADPIIPVMKDGKMHWYQVPADLYNTLSGLDIYRLPKALDLLLAAPVRAFKLGTTGLRASFSLFTNPVRDIQTGLIQSQAKNPALFMLNYLKAIGSALNPKRITGKMGPDLDMFHRVGGPLSQPLGIDEAVTTKASKRVFQSMPRRVISQPINALRDIFSVTESIPRIAEMKSIADQVGYKMGEPMTFDQAVQIGLATKQSTVDFSAMGKAGKVLNQVTPFFNANVQGTRSFVRAFQRSPVGATLKAVTAITLPTLALWWANKDKEWWKDMPDREKNMYWNIEHNGEVLQIPRAQEVGGLFGTLPEAAADSWYQKDAEGLKKAMGYLFDLAAPPIEPQVVKVGHEQWANNIEFFDKPIVPKSEEDLPPPEQANQYTSDVAKWLGENLPDAKIMGIPVNSPRRIDAFIRSMGGGVASDLAQITKFKTPADWEASDYPIIGRMFRRGGVIGTGSKAVNKFYEELAKAKEREASKKTPETASEREYRMQLEDANKALKILREASTQADKDKKLEIAKMGREIVNKVMRGDSPFTPGPEKDPDKKTLAEQKGDAKTLSRYLPDQNIVEAPRNIIIETVTELQKVPKDRRSAETEKAIAELLRSGQIKKEDQVKIRSAVAMDKSPVLMQMDEADGDDFVALLEKAMKDADEKDKAKLLMRTRQKWAAATSAASKSKYKAAIDRYSEQARQVMQPPVDGRIFPHRRTPEFLKNIERRWRDETPIDAKWEGQRPSENIEDQRTLDRASMWERDLDAESVNEIIDNAEGGDDERKILIDIAKQRVKEFHGAERRKLIQIIQKHQQAVKQAERLRRQGVVVGN